MLCAFVLFYAIGLILISKASTSFTGVLFGFGGFLLCGLGGAFAVASWGIGVSDPTRMAASKPGFTYSENDKITGDYYSPRYPNELLQPQGVKHLRLPQVKYRLLNNEK